MNYDEACEIEVTKAEAIRELEKHFVDISDFFNECGEHDTYLGEVVLNWLGY